MENIFLYQLVDAVKGEFLLGDPHSSVTAVSIDTRTLHKDDYYFAIKGKSFDGHDFLKNAIDKHAKGIVISIKEANLGKPFPYMPAIVSVKDTTLALGDFARYYRKKFTLPVVGITGSNGKTTTKEMLATILQQLGPILKNQGNFNNTIGLPMTIFNMNSEHAFAVLEMGTSSFGEIKRLTEIAAPTVGVITNIGLAHLENFRDKDGVLEEKKALVEQLEQGSCAVLNYDDPQLGKLIGSIKSNAVTFGLNPKADIFASDIKLWPGKPVFKLNISGKVIEIKLPVYGQHNIMNALCAAAAVKALGLDTELIKFGLEKFVSPKMRMEVKTLMNGVTLINDAYNANPSSMREAVKGLSEAFPDRDKVVVLGDMLELGGSSAQEHAELGKFLDSQPLSRIFLLGEQMQNAMEPLNNTKAVHFMKKEDLTAELKVSIPQGAVVLFKASRGMKLEEVIDNLFPNEETA